MRDPSPQVLVLGKLGTPEMRPVETALTIASSGEVERADCVDAAVRLVTKKCWFPDLVVVCQQWPREFTRRDVERLLNLLPLARWVCCFGAWCESDGRNNGIWPAAVRVPARCAASRLRRELAVLAGRLPALPLTAGRDEIFAFDCADESRRPRKNAGRERSRISQNSGGRSADRKSPVPVLLATPDAALRDGLTDLLAGAGYRAMVERDDQRNGGEGDPAVVVFDVDPWGERTAERLRNLRSRHPHAAFVALAAFAHIEDVETWKACGIGAVVTKLSAQYELLEALSSSESANPFIGRKAT